MLVAAIAAFAAFLPAGANAAISSTLTQTFASTAPGANSTYTNLQAFDPLEATPHAADDDLYKWILDSPAGQVGNVNAIPYDQRCTLDQFNATTGPDGFGAYTNGCPTSSIVGIAVATLALDASDAAYDGNGVYPSVTGFGMATSLARFSSIPASVDTYGTPGTIYLLQTTPEVPTTLATHFHLSGSRTKSVLQPVTSGTDGDFRIRVVPADPSVTPAGVYISQIMQRLHAKSGAGMDENPWLFNPTRCDDWTGYSYAREYETAGNENADSFPDIDNPTHGYKKSAGDTITPDCATLPTFSPSSSVTLSTTDRDSNPQVDFLVNGIGTMGNDFPKKVVTTLPASITTDVQGIGNPCEVANRDANTCPAASKVGTAKVTTPLVTAGLTGDVYMIRGTGKAIPDLAIFFNNPPNSIRSFRMDGTTKFVGPNNNQIETTFDNGPQSPFSSFQLTINGGTDTLLTISKCPDGSASPEDGPITMTMTGFSGQSAATTTTPALKDCFGVAKLKKFSKCVRYNLKVSPLYSSRSGLMKSELWVKAKRGKNKGKYIRIRVVRTDSFRLNKKLRSSRFNSGTYRYKVRAVYNPTAANPKSAVYQRYSTFRKC